MGKIKNEIQITNLSPAVSFFFNTANKNIFNKYSFRKFNKMKVTILLIFCMFLLSCGKHVNPISPNGEVCEGDNGTISSSGRWQEFNTSNSCLSSNTIRCLAIDHNNNLWIGTDEGLVFYDGTQWIIYNTSNSKLPFNVILSIACEDDIVWVGGGGALAKFDGRNWVIYNSSNSPLSSSLNFIELTINTLKVDSKHNIWIGTNYYGLYKFDKTNWTLYYPNFRTPISSPSIRSIDIDEHDLIWIAHAEPTGVDNFDGSDWTNYSPDNSPLPSWYINKVYIDEMNTKWFTTNFGLAEFDDINWVIYDTTNPSLQDEIIFSISSNNKNNLWAGTFSGALLTRNDGEWVAYYINDASEPAIPYNTINCVKVDNYDNKWLGTYNGLYKFNENGVRN